MATWLPKLIDTSWKLRAGRLAAPFASANDSALAVGTGVILPSS
jgi:hypothetical protein